MRICHFSYFKFSSNPFKFDKSKNYYHILKIQPTSSKAVIRNAYLNLAKKHHPDVNPTGKDQFTLIQQAYQVLSNESHKKQYEQFYRENSYRQSSSSNRNGKQKSWESSQQSYKHYEKYQEYKHYKQEGQFKGQRQSKYYQQYNWKDDFEAMQKKRKEWTRQFYEQEKKRKNMWERSPDSGEQMQKLKKIIFENTQQGLLERLWKRYSK